MVGDDGLSSMVDLTLGGQDASSEEYPDDNNCDPQSNIDESAVAVSLKEIDATGSTVSLNELLDSCIFDGENNADVFADSDAAFTDPSGWVAVGDIIGKQWIENFLENPKTPVSDDHGDDKTCGNSGLAYHSATGVSDTLPDFLLSIRNCYKRSFTDGMQNHCGSSDFDLSGKLVANDSGCNGLHQSLTLSNVSSSGSTVESTRIVDDGYHSNATSATSPGVNGSSVAEQLLAAR